jgi:hypothetical protein
VTARQLTVAHQAPGECAYCDERHAAIVAAVAHELAEQQRTDANLRATEGETELATDGHELANLINPKGQA